MLMVFGRFRLLKMRSAAAAAAVAAAAAAAAAVAAAVVAAAVVVVHLTVESRISWSVRGRSSILCLRLDI